MTETIEIRAKEVIQASKLGIPQSVSAPHQFYHLYVIYTDNTGTEYILLGGPENNFFTSDIEIVGASSSVEYSADNSNSYSERVAI